MTMQDAIPVTQEAEEEQYGGMVTITILAVAAITFSFGIGVGLVAALLFY